MKSIFRFTIPILFIIFLSATYTNTPEVLQTYLASDKKINQPTISITHQQTKAQVNFFREALDKFGATSPEQVISIWADAEKTRNGVLHYAVACNELKSKIIQEAGEPSESFWIIGGSSPWLERYEVVYNKKLSNSEYEAKLKFFWISSVGPSEPIETTLHIVKNRDTWCVKEIK